VFNLPHYSDGDMTNWKAAFRSGWSSVTWWATGASRSPMRPPALRRCVGGRLRRRL